MTYAIKVFILFHIWVMQSLSYECPGCVLKKSLPYAFNDPAKQGEQKPSPFSNILSNPKPQNHKETPFSSPPLLKRDQILEKARPHGPTNPLDETHQRNARMEAERTKIPYFPRRTF